MSELTRLEVTGIRNLLDVCMQPQPGLNLIYGENGSGKTSLLEAIHLLSTGRSFRSGRVGSLINHQRDTALVVIHLADGTAIGLEKSRHKGNTLKLNGRNQQGWEEVARRLPVQVLDAHAFQLLEGGPKARRRFLDWGVFHVEHSFLAAWRDARRCLANRNLLLRRMAGSRGGSAAAAGTANGEAMSQISAWNEQLSKAAAIVDQARRAYFAEFLPRADAMYRILTGGEGVAAAAGEADASGQNSPQPDSLRVPEPAAQQKQDNATGAEAGNGAPAQIAPPANNPAAESPPPSGPPPVTLDYEPGWDASRPLQEVLQDSLQQDIKYRSTQQGPHRADIVVHSRGERAVEVLSRGQQKLLVCALKLAQGSMLAESLGKKCIYLADDLPAELDPRNTAAVLAALQSQQGQLFVTSANRQPLENAAPAQANAPTPPMFHMEHGQITEIDSHPTTG